MCATRTAARSGRRPRFPSANDASRYVARHGQGYSRFEHVSHGIALDLLQFVPLDDPIKISRLKITNRLGPPRGACRSRPMSNGCSARRAPPARPISSPRSIPKPARYLRAIPGAWSSAPRRVCRSRRPAAVVDRRPHRVPRPQRHARFAGRARHRSAAVQPGRRRPRSLRRAADRSSRLTANARNRNYVSCWARRRRQPKPRRWSSDTAPPISMRSSAT